MFKKYTALAAAMLLASSQAVSLAECAVRPGFQGYADCYWQDCGATFNPFGCISGAEASTCDAFCATSWCVDTTCSQFCATCGECDTTCGPDCMSDPLCDPTAVPQPTPTVQPTQKPSATQAPSTGDDYTTQSVSAQEQKMANLLNQDRNSAGLGALTLDPELCRIARIKSADMRDNGYFAHESPIYGNIRDMLQRFGYPFQAAGENIAHHANVDKAQAAFMSSDGHRQNILGNWTKVGIGIVTDAQGYIYATQIFAR